MKNTILFLFLTLSILYSPETFARKTRSDKGGHHIMMKHRNHKESSTVDIPKEKQILMDSMELYTIYNFKGIVSTIEQLPNDSNSVGDMYEVIGEDSTEFYYWFDNSWITSSQRDNRFMDLENRYLNWKPEEKKKEEIKTNPESMFKGLILLGFIILGVFIYRRYKKNK